METILLDVKYALRMLRKQPGFTIVALATLALGIGATTAIFSVLYAVLLQPLPYRDADRVIRIFAATGNGRESGASRLDFDDWKSQSRSFSSLAAYRGESADVLGGSEPERVVALQVGSGFFEAFGVKPLVGRTFDAEREVASGTPPAVISEGFWKSHFGGRAGVVGNVVRIAGSPHVVVGVLPAEFEYPWKQDLYLPLGRSDRDLSRSARNYHIVARLKDGVTLEAAAAELRTIAARQARAFPDTNAGMGVALRTLRDDLTATVRPTLWLLFGFVGLVLLIACANLAGLLVARGRGRAAEVALRGALGAKTPRLVRQLLTENVVLALIGGGLGLLIAFWISRLLASSSALDWLPLREPLLNAKVLAFAFGVSLVTAILSGIVPALRVARTELSLQKMLRRDVKDPVRRQLVAIEVALSVLLLVAAGLLGRSMFRLQNERLGFDPSSVRVLTANAPSTEEGTPAAFANATAFYDAVLQRVQGIPGVQSVAASNNFPLDAEKLQGGIALEGRNPLDEKSWQPAGWQLVSEDYFRALNIPLLRGRTFQQSDRGGVKVVVVSEELARRYWPNENAIGKRLAVPGLDSESYENFQNGKIDWITVVGTAADVRAGGPATEPMPEIYLPYFQHAVGNLKIAVRSAVAGASLDRTLDTAVRGVAADVPVRVRSYEEVLERRLAAPKLRSQLILLFAILAIVLAAGGIYGVTANWVEQRRREIGIRIAHGAKAQDVFTLFLRRAVASTFIGIVAGLLGAVWLADFLSPFLFRIDPRDPATFIGALLIATATALIATVIPAMRAARVDPAETLRYE
jgi:putative ABC transport system permease protein